MTPFFVCKILGLFCILIVSYMGTPAFSQR
jgi:hypothetical protein